MKWEEWLAAVAALFDCTPEFVLKCRQDEPRDCFDMGDTPQEYHDGVIAEDGELSDEEV